MGGLPFRGIRWHLVLQCIVLLLTLVLQVYDPDVDGDGQGEGAILGLCGVLLCSHPYCLCVSGEEPDGEVFRRISRLAVLHWRDKDQPLPGLWLIAKRSLVPKEWDVFYMHVFGDLQQDLCCRWLHMTPEQFEYTLAAAETHMGQALYAQCTNVTPVRWQMKA